MIILTVFSALALIAVCYCVYRKQQAKNDQRRTRTILREQQDSEEVRNRKIIEAVRKSCECDVDQN